MKKIWTFIKKKKILFYLFLFFLFLFYSAIIVDNGDNYLNYGFAYNVANGMVPYRDFNMIVFPFCSFIGGFFLKLFGTNLITFYMFNSIIYVLIIYLVNKIDKSTVPIVLFMLVIYGITGYNIMSLLLFFIIMILEEKSDNKLIMGIVLGIAIATNQKLVLLLIPALLHKTNVQRIQIIEGVIIPLQILLMYLFMNGALSYFIDYTILGLIDFGGNNFNIDYCIIIIIGVLTYMIYKYWKERDDRMIYCIMFLIISYPIFDIMHVLVVVIPFVVYCCSAKGSSENLVKLAFTILIIFYIGISGYRTLSNPSCKVVTDKSSNFYLTIERQIPKRLSEKILKFYNDNKNETDIYFLLYEAYYFKLSQKLPINKFDLSLVGNNGYNGTECLKEEIKNMKHALFLVDNYTSTSNFDQTNYELINFIKENYEKIDSIENYISIYEIKN